MRIRVAKLIERLPYVWGWAWGLSGHVVWSGSHALVKRVLLVIVTKSFFSHHINAAPAGSLLRPRHNSKQKSKDERPAKMSGSENKGATAPKRVESDVYDRQIRLWGADAQVRTTFSCLIFVGWSGG